MKMKKVKAVLAAFALIAMMPFQVMAADGSIMFSDLTEETGRSVKTGETAEIKFAVASTAGAIGEANVTLTYDASALRAQKVSQREVKKDRWSIREKGMEQQQN